LGPTGLQPVRKIRAIRQEKTWMDESRGIPPLPQKQSRGKDGAPSRAKHKLEKNNKEL
jgi:hypothetical protein